MPNATACEHKDRPMKARGLCKSCWSREQRVGWKKPTPIAATPVPGGVHGKPGKVKVVKHDDSGLPVHAQALPLATTIDQLGPDRILVTLAAIGSTDAQAKATKAAKDAGHTVKTIAKVAGGTPGSKVAERWTVELAVKVPTVDPDDDASSMGDAGDGAVLVPDAPAGYPLPDPLPAGMTTCPDCEEAVTKSNLSRHRKRRHVAAPVPA